MTADQHEFDPLLDDLPRRFVVGIDLGTTNSALAYVDSREDPWRIRVFPVPQLVAPEQVESREILPSFHYDATPAEIASGALRLAWSASSPDHAVGFFAQEEGAKTPGRLIASAKSWLCHSGVDRTAELLPWQGASDVQRLSPVEVSARYLRHMRDAWNARFPAEPLANQDVVLTLPASFDEVARELTVEAASRAGLPRVVLIEEPLAAFYSWVYHHAEDWHQRVEPGQTILVCDIGGGTSDFTLIRVRLQDTADGKKQPPPPIARDGPDRAHPHPRAADAQHPKSPSEPSLSAGSGDEGGDGSGDGGGDGGGDGSGGQRIRFHRVAVGEHLILGGDNLDLALAEFVERQAMREGKLPSHSWELLVRKCRRIKETLLGGDAPERLTVHLPATGSRLIGGGQQIELVREEVRELLIEGFLPRVPLNARPARRQSGFQEFGLPYAADPAITRYLAAFLTAHRDTGPEAGPPRDQSAARPDVVLLNGGFFAARPLRERLLEVIRSWFSHPGSQDWAPLVLENARLDLAVAIGAAYYGMVRRGLGVRVSANLGRSYYIGIESAEPQAVCLIPGSAEAGQDFALSNRVFQLTIAEPVEFPLYVSSIRLSDAPGDLLPVDAEQMTLLPPIRTVLRTQRRSQRGSVRVELHARLTEIGTMDLWCRDVDRERSWRLQFDIRSTTQTDRAAHVASAEQAGFLEEEAWQICAELIAGVFSPEGRDSPDGLAKRLAAALECQRGQWPPSLLRRIWEVLMEWEAGRRRTVVHETRWLNLLGYALRPGYGMAVDDWRVAETWRAVHGKLVYPVSANESLILWRRIAGGLTRGQQATVAERLLVQVRALHQRHQGGKRRQSELLVRPEETTEIWRLLGSLELLPVPVKAELGGMLTGLLPRKKLQGARSAMIWALGRLGQRVPVYGPLNTVVPRQHAEAWLEALYREDPRETIAQLAAMQIARRTDDRHRDLDEQLRREAADWLIRGGAAPHWIELVRDGGRLDSEDQEQVIGESLPKGLRIVETVVRGS